ncbi:MAG: type I methionyl aminopeptidase [Candidatus Pacebacteria bacterium]|nr:type I methionyl aminopeptidase [Candidatus Paceibacterota bacterium]
MAWTKTKEEIKILREGGKRHAYILSCLREATFPGVSTKELDNIAESLIRENGDLPSLLNYKPEGASYPFPASVCISVNDEIVHGIPSERILKNGDIVSFDFCMTHKNLITDSTITVPVGVVSKELKGLILVTNNALYAGIEAAQLGSHIGDIGFAISRSVKDFGYGVIRDLAGHGVGHKVHEDPFIPNYGKKGEGYELEEGMVLALEPMFTLGSPHISLADDGYTVFSKDRSTSAHSEHTIAITKEGPLILTEQ